MNIMTIDGFQATIFFVPDMKMFRGEFINLSGGADFYATDVQGLEREGKISLDIYLDACKRNGISPRKIFSGNFSLRLDPEVHEAATIAAASKGVSLNHWAAQSIKQAALAS